MDQGGQSNFNVVTTGRSAKGDKKSLIIGAIVVAVLAVSIPAGVFLVKQQQDIKEKAQEALVCPAVEACPVAGQSTLLRSCYSVLSGQSPDEVSCSAISNVGSVVTCGTTKFCCPSLGASWTTNVDLCTALTPTSTGQTSINAVTPTPTDSATPTATASATPTATSSATPTATASAMPVPVSGVSWPTIFGMGVGILVILGSILLAL